MPEPKNQARLLFKSPEGEERVQPLGESTRLGRAANGEVVLPGSAVSRRHALIQRGSDGEYILTDLGSANGTSVNDEEVLLPVVLRDGDRIEISGFELFFSGDPSRDAGLERGDTLFTTADVTLNDAPGGGDGRVQIIGGGPRMLEVLSQVGHAAQSNIPILITGETGTGKELVARAIHESSPRAAGVFVPINCSALPEALLESELFGHRKGSFTGAQQDRAGLFEAAQGGTVFLDEIGELPLAMQPKLLRFLQDGEVRRIGDVEPRRVDARVISATNRNLLGEIQAGTFREDLYFRLSTFTIELPPLRERREDIPLLAERLLRRQAARQGKRVRGIGPPALEALSSYTWPGNVRDLENEIARAVAVIEDGARVSIDNLSHRILGSGASGAGAEPTDAPVGSDLKGATADFERKHIAAVLEEHDDNVSRAAEALGLSRGGLHKKLKELGLR
jgi:transcriptional regulator with PAS, ATPase and Fis domain